MTINIQFVNLDYSVSLAEHTTKKLNKMAEKYDWLISADVFFKEEGTNPEKGKICNIKLSLPGPQIFATSDEKNFEMAVKETINDLVIQLKKRKQTFMAH
ncbi:HPF/RaiA family ribosome-associated protein [Gelidibacter japonicus]|jgi:putative sigma-54 modulation protein|uniref:HPF/RaiA family ribosome-associated protein n=1 Tax=Gelidibacter japonicus TaxID=1962232 RepID=UPI0013D33EE2|nr:HPF/RaiA family ribosome-associated protein [Gelidibacter japonicus]MCL8007790.1 HPF/RaiA family ribosome-associated protein [Gelidibacter japonicus]